MNRKTTPPAMVDRRLAGRAAEPNRPISEQREPEQRSRARRRRGQARRRRTGVPRRRAQRGDRRHAGRAQRGRQRRHHRHADADDQRDDDRAGASSAPAVGMPKPDGLEQRRQALANSSPSSRPITDAVTPMTSASQRHGCQDLAARGAERAQHRELARPLRDRDRERVEDDERADEQRGARRRRAARASGSRRSRR